MNAHVNHEAFNALLKTWKSAAMRFYSLHYRAAQSAATIASAVLKLILPAPPMKN